MSLQYICARSGRLAFLAEPSSRQRFSIPCRCRALPNRTLPDLSSSATAPNEAFPCRFLPSDRGVSVFRQADNPEIYQLFRMTRGKSASVYAFDSNGCVATNANIQTAGKNVRAPRRRGDHVQPRTVSGILARRFYLFFPDSPGFRNHTVGCTV